MTLPDKLPGHWITPDGAEMAKRYVGVTRHQLFGGDFTDFEAAHRVAMTMRSDLDFEASLALARDRIRWLSVQLAIAQAGGKVPPPGLATSGGVSPSSTESARTPGEHMKRGEQ